MGKAASFIWLLALISTFVHADEHTHLYEDNEEVILWMNTVGPYSNRQETYSYFSLPFCRGPKESISHYHETLGEALLGVELEHSGIDIRYKGLLFCYTELFLIKETLQYQFQKMKYVVVLCQMMIMKL